MIRDNCLIYVSDEDDMDDVPLATRLKKRRVEKTGEKSRHAEEINHSEEINLGSSMRRAGSQLVGGKSQSYDIHMKRNKVYVYLNDIIFFTIYLAFGTLVGCVLIFCCDVIQQFECIVKGTFVYTDNIFRRKLKGSGCDQSLLRAFVGQQL